MTTYTILRLPQVIQRTGLARSTIYLRMKSGDFPTPIRLGARSVGWRADELNDWIESRTRTRTATPLPVAESGTTGAT